MWGRLQLIVTLVAGLSFGSGLAEAGILAIAPGPIVQGTELFSSVGPPAVGVEVDYAVFAPGTLDPFLLANALPGADPSGGTSFAYVYQAFNVASGAGVTSMTIGVDALDPLDGATPGWMGAGTNPINGAFNGGTNAGPTSGVDGSVVWNYFGTLGVGTSSSMMIFTSPVSYEFDSAQVNVSTSSALGHLPSPLPEPHALAIIGLAGLACLRRRNMRRM